MRSGFALSLLREHHATHPVQQGEGHTEAAVKARLIQIKDAEEQYRQQHQGEFCDTLDVLINFIKTARIPHVTKVGELSDKQMESGLTESKAAAIVNSGDAAAIAANGLQNFRRDTTWTPHGRSHCGYRR